MKRKKESHGFLNGHLTPKTHKKNVMPHVQSRKTKSYFEKTGNIYFKKYN